MRCSAERMTAWRVLLGGEAVCSFLREAAVPFVNHCSVRARVNGAELPLSVICPCLPKEPALWNGSRDGKDEKQGIYRLTGR